MPNLRESIEKRFSKLTRVQKGLIQSILADYEEFIFLSVDEAGRRLDVHKSTLVRLAQTLGYDGYTDLRTKLQELYRQEITPGEKLGRTLADLDGGSLYQQVIESEVLYLKESLKTIRNEDIHRAAEILVNAERIFICGRGAQRSLAELFEFRLRRFHFDVLAVREEGRAILERLQLMTTNDALILFSFIDVPAEHRHAIELAKDVGCPTILVTDSVAREMVDHVTVTLAARRGPATIYHTNMVPMAIMTAIVLDIARLRSEDILPALDRLQQLRRKFGYEYSVSHRPDGEDPAAG